MAAESRADVHHGASICLLRLFDATAEDLCVWSEFDEEVERLSVEVRSLSREDLRAMIENFYLRDPYHRASRAASGSQRLGAMGQTRWPKNPGPLRPAVLLAARPLPMGTHRSRSPYPAELVALSSESIRRVFYGATHESLLYDKRDSQVTSAAIEQVIDACVPSGH